MENSTPHDCTEQDFNSSITPYGVDAEGFVVSRAAFNWRSAISSAQPPQKPRKRKTPISKWTVWL